MNNNSFVIYVINYSKTFGNDIKGNRRARIEVGILGKTGICRKNISPRRKINRRFVPRKMIRGKNAGKLFFKRVVGDSLSNLDGTAFQMYWPT